MITSSVNRVIYKGNGVATEFAYPFKIFDRTDIKVLLVDKDGNRSILTSDYYVDMEAMKVYYPGYAPGAVEPEVDRPEILGEGETLVIYREVPITQMDRLPDNYPFNVIEEMDDRDCVVSQQLNDKLSRAIVVGEETGMEFDGTIAIQPGKTFAVNEEGTGFVLATNPDVIAAQITAALGVTETNVNTALMATTEYVDGKVEATEQNVNNSLTSTENRINSALSTTEANVNRAITSNTEYVNQKTQATENNVAAALATTEGNVTAELNETKQTVNQKVEQVQALVDSLGGLTIEALEAVRDECLEKAGEAQTAADSALAAASELQGTVVQVETNTADITNIYSTKADKATSLSGYGITNAYTKTEVTSLLNNKANTSSLSAVAFSGRWEDLTTHPNLPTIPANISYFNNDAGYLTEHQDISGKQDKLTAGENITITGNVISATAGNSGATVVDSGTSTDGTIWYRKWSDGWLEQGGFVNAPRGVATVNLPKSFVNNNKYTVILSNDNLNATASWYLAYVTEKETNRISFRCPSTAVGNVPAYSFEWYACGEVNE